MQGDGRTDQVVIMEYRKLRDEQVARLGWQQNLVRYVLIVAGSLPALLSQPVRDLIGPEALPFVLLVGPLLSLFILGSMLKHHVYICLIGTYMSSELGRDAPFSPWPAYFSRAVYSTWRRRIVLSAFVGAWEFLVPLGVAGLYIWVSWLTAQEVRPTDQSKLWCAYPWALCLSVVFLFAAVVVLVAFWKWLTDLLAGSVDDKRKPREASLRRPWRDIIYEAVLRTLRQSGKDTFTPSEIYHEVLTTYPSVNPATNRRQITAGCVNCPARKHHSGLKPDRYFKVERGIYRLYDPKRDGVWDQEGKQVEAGAMSDTGKTEG